MKILTATFILLSSAGLAYAQAPAAHPNDNNEATHGEVNQGATPQGQGQTNNAAAANSAANNSIMNDATKSGQGASNQQQQNGTARQQITKNLQNAGFTDVQVMPQSFLVRARDHDGNPVMMVVNPDSVTAITQVGGTAPNGGTNSGGGSNNGNNTANNGGNKTTH